MIYQFFRRNRSPRAAILIMKYQFRYWNLGRKKQTTAKGKQRSGNNRRTKQSKQPNVNFSKASTRSSNENAKMQANHPRNQSRKAAEVLLKGLEGKLRPVVRTLYQNSSNDKSWRNTRRSEHCIWNLFLQLLRTQTKPIKKNPSSVYLQPLKITLVKFTYPSQRPKIPSLSHYGSCAYPVQRTWGVVHWRSGSVNHSTEFNSI